jgi:electron transfer flavoprotein alpha subunit
MPIEGTGRDLAGARVVVAGGRGVGSREGFLPLERLAGLLGGAVGASRAAVEAGFAPYSRQVGQTGLTVKPELYLAFGISGSVQHVAGMSGSAHLIAVNADPAAPIFGRAELGIVGDAVKTAEAMVRVLEDGKR